MTASTEQLLNTVAAMTVNEIVELTRAIEEKFDVKASDVQSKLVIKPIEEPQEEQTEFDVVIKDVGIRKIEVIKRIRVITDLGLKQSKDLAEPNTVIAAAVSKKDAEAMKKAFEEAGATVELK